jgi:lysozyme
MYRNRVITVISISLILMLVGYQYKAQVNRVTRYVKSFVINIQEENNTPTGTKIDTFAFSDNDIYGIDVSHYQKKIDWTKVSTNSNPEIEFVYIKCSEGVTLKDDRFKYNYKNAKQNGLRVGVYHFFSPSTTGKNQFIEFSRVYPGSQNDLPILVDCERMGDSRNAYLKELHLFLELCEKHYGSRPLIYSTQRFYNTHLKGRVNNYELMIARYNNKKHEPNLLDGREWDIWQFSQTGQVDGIPKPVDLDVAKHRFWE